MFTYYSTVYCVSSAGSFGDDAYALAMFRNSPHLDVINAAISQLQSQGEMISLRAKYFTPSSATQAVCKDSSFGQIFTSILSTKFVPTSRLSISSVELSGIFVIAFLGLAGALFVAVIESLIRLIQVEFIIFHLFCPDPLLALTQAIHSSITDGSCFYWILSFLICHVPDLHSTSFVCVVKHVFYSTIVAALAAWNE
ncbi:unnamed protein product [Protopolystoma xenopodis]|uniref:Uncharacterized protein n=1 Tax=Protopolystoma xenopodis TaxID=117903 RepID=A0A448WYK4_9PLAT|nr:unnamed protein product [Protopolystoma xenopodis]